MFDASCSVNHAEKNLGFFQQTPDQLSLISKDISSPNRQQILSGLRLPEGFTIGEAIGRGDCFFDAVAQGQAVKTWNKLYCEIFERSL